jgi:hypothetical protein
MIESIVLNRSQLKIALTWLRRNNIKYTLKEGDILSTILVSKNDIIDLSQLFPNTTNNNVVGKPKDRKIWF